MMRKLVSKNELVEIINSELQKIEDCRGCAVVGSIRQLDSPLSDGGNWNRSIAIGGRPRNPQACGEAAHDLIVKIAEEFNLD
jgi:hypothetical protein